MTYGWAILVVLVVIGALSYFGVLSPATLLPEKCTFPVSMSCVDHQVKTSEIRLILLNGAGRDMIIESISASSDALGLPAATTPKSCETANAGLPAGELTLRNGQKNEFLLATIIDTDGCTFRDTGRDKNKYNITVRFKWLDSQTLQHRLTGELLAKGP